MAFTSDQLTTAASLSARPHSDDTGITSHTLINQHSRRPLLQMECDSCLPRGMAQWEDAGPLMPPSKCLRDCLWCRGNGQESHFWLMPVFIACQLNVHMALRSSSRQHCVFPRTPGYCTDKDKLQHGGCWSLELWRCVKAAASWKYSPTTLLVRIPDNLQCDCLLRAQTISSL